MAFNISEVGAEINRLGVMRNNKFLLEMPMPLSLRGNSLTQPLADANRVISLYCEASNVPGIALLMEEVRRYGYGPNEKRPYAPIFTDINLTFRSDSYGMIWNFMNSWMRCAVNYQSRGDFNTPNGPIRNQYPNEIGYKYDPKNNEGYAVDAVLRVFNDVGDETLQIVMREAFPIFVGDIPLNWGARSDYARIPVTLSFFDWFVNTQITMNTGNIPVNNGS